MLTRTVALAGLAGGLALGILIAGIWRWPRVALIGTAGAILAAALSFAIPDRYVSTALLRGRDVGVLHLATGKVFSDHNKMTEILRKAGSGGTLADITVQQDSRDLAIRVVSADRFSAQRAAQKFVTAVMVVSMGPPGEARLGPPG